MMVWRRAEKKLQSWRSSTSGLRSPTQIEWFFSPGRIRLELWFNLYLQRNLMSCRYFRTKTHSTRINLVRRSKNLSDNQKTYFSNELFWLLVKLYTEISWINSKSVGGMASTTFILSLLLLLLLLALFSVLFCKKQYWIILQNIAIDQTL